jgi:hypothetical protein
MGPPAAQVDDVFYACAEEHCEKEDLVGPLSPELLDDGTLYVPPATRPGRTRLNRNVNTSKLHCISNCGLTK